MNTALVCHVSLLGNESVYGFVLMVAEMHNTSLAGEQNAEFSKVQGDNDSVIFSCVIQSVHCLVKNV